MMQERAIEIADNLERVRRLVADAVTDANRSIEDVTVVAVTKTWPSSDIRILAGLGVTDVAENKAQELTLKVADCRDLSLRWRFVGQLQRNKVKLVVPKVACIESIDRPELVAAIGAFVERTAADEVDPVTGRSGVAPITCLVQVNLDVEQSSGRAGVRPADALSLADQIASTQGVLLGGVMGVAPRHGDARHAFDTLKEVSDRITDRYRSATVISAGMSGDFVAAIRAGATHIRLGSALLGTRAGFVR